MRWLGVLFVVGCSGATDQHAPDAITHVDLDIPPQGHAELKLWLAGGFYTQWACEDAPHPARPPGAHGTNRICSNDILASSTSGPYPVGAASVKELWQSGRVTGFAVGRKITAGDDASSWYWYEAYGDNVIADGVNRGICVNCHAGAPRDYVFTSVLR